MTTGVLASWNDTPTRAAIVDFVERVTTEGGADYAPPPERIATFDNDGTLWSEQPLQVQVFFLADLLVAVVERKGAGRVVGLLRGLLERRG